MIGHSLIFILTILLWWASTGLILMVCSLPKHTFGRSLAMATPLFFAALYGLQSSAHNTGAASTYVGFLSAVAIWGWLEMGFLMGYVTGPRTAPCPADAAGWRRFALAVETLLYRELSVLAAALSVLLLTWGAPNQVGCLTFFILLVMRVSAELNIFLGVPYSPEQLLPERLVYLKSYFRIRKLNILFPISILGASVVAYSLAEQAFDGNSAQHAGAGLMFTLLVLAILEHIFMVVPLPDDILWRWARQVSVSKPIEKTTP